MYQRPHRKEQPFAHFLCGTRDQGRDPVIMEIESEFLLDLGKEGGFPRSLNCDPATLILSVPFEIPSYQRSLMRLRNDNLKRPAAARVQCHAQEQSPDSANSALPPRRRRSMTSRRSRCTA